MKIEPSIKIVKIIIKNFRGIGNTPLEIDLDDIVVLVGPNNSGKSTVLKAFEIISKGDSELVLEDFHDSLETNKPEIEVWSKIFNIDKVTIAKDKWVSSESIVREKWCWDTPGKSKRMGFRIDKDGGRWAIPEDDVLAPFSNDGASSHYRPSPTYISAFEQPEKQLDNIKKLIADDIFLDLKNTKKVTSNYTAIESQLAALYKEIRTESDQKERDIEKELNSILNSIFKGTKIDISVPESKPDLLSNYATSKDITININNLPLENQGSGMQKTLLWSVLKMLAEKEKPAKTTSKSKGKKIEVADTEPITQEKTRILLIDEPEICLHPDSIRKAKEILYQLPTVGNWQIMITTHSPIFIDVSKDNSVLIRVDKNDKEGCKIYRPESSMLSSDEKEQLKMLNIFDPYFAEFFFSKKIIVVEGDTEYTAFRKIMDEDQESYEDVHIIRARGKATIIPIIKILSKWSSNFSVLHDSDTEKLENGNKNPAWTINENILGEVTKNQTAGLKIKLVANKVNFEKSFFGTEVKVDKPFNAYKELDDTVKKANVTKLLNFLSQKDLTLDVSLGNYVIEYKLIDDLLKYIT